MENRGLFARAIQDFRHARSQAALETLTARLRRRSAVLLSFEEVREKLHIVPSGTQEVETIPLDAIIGSVGRYADFTRSYRPLADKNEQRWAMVKMAVNDPMGVPPIEVYQIGDAYFVKDGNHRVSVYREMGTTHIQAVVTKLLTRVKISPDDDIDDIIIKAEQLEFIEYTQLNKLRPKAEIKLSIPGAYRDIQEHILIYQKYLSQEEEKQVSLEEAVIAWYDSYYAVVVHNIHRLGILRDFPNHTEGDIYMLVWEHRGVLMEKTKIAVSVDLATEDLAVQKGESALSILARSFRKIFKLVFPGDFGSGPAPGRWREQMATMKHRKDSLFGYVLVPMSAERNHKHGLDQAIIIAKRERSTLYGLHVLLPRKSEEDPTVKQLRILFEERCKKEGVEGYFNTALGNISREIVDRSRWTDLVVTSLSHPPGKKRLKKFSPDFDLLIRTCPTPILVIPDNPSHFRRALVAYDGSPKAREALFVAVYMAHKLETELIVIWVQEDGKPDNDKLEDMKYYLNKNEVKSTFLEVKGSVPEAIVKTASQEECDLILIGGYGKTPALEMLLGSTVDEVLRTSRIPILVCR